jgi:hypothetical protein
MRDDACLTHRKPDATNDVLEARVGANVVSGGINTQIGDVLALGERFLERLQCRVLVSRLCVMQISRIG